jgi:ribosomal protein L16 Arg81 hydroxylase
VNDRIYPTLFGGRQVCESMPAFESCLLGSEPLAAAGMARGLAEHFDWFCLEAMLASAEADVVLVAGGPVAPWHAPRDLKQLRHCFGSKIGLTVRSAERFCPKSKAIADDLGRELGPARVHLSATPSQGEGAWHYEDEHLFIVQTAGVKDYYFRANTVAGDVPAGDKGFAAYANESSRLWSARLRPGDVLYLPTRWWRKERAEQEALSLSIGVTLPPQPRHGLA